MDRRGIMLTCADLPRLQHVVPSSRGVERGWPHLLGLFDGNIPGSSRREDSPTLSKLLLDNRCNVHGSEWPSRGTSWKTTDK